MVLRLVNLIRSTLVPRRCLVLLLPAVSNISAVFRDHTSCSRERLPHPRHPEKPQSPSSYMLHHHFCFSDSSRIAREDERRQRAASSTRKENVGQHHGESHWLGKKTQKQTHRRGRVLSASTRRLVCHLHRDSFFCIAITRRADFLSLNSPLPPSKPSSQTSCDNANPRLHRPSSSSPSLRSFPRRLPLRSSSVSVTRPSCSVAKSRPRSQNGARKMSLAARLIRADSHGLKCHAFPAHVPRRPEH